MDQKRVYRLVLTGGTWNVCCHRCCAGVTNCAPECVICESSVNVARLFDVKSREVDVGRSRGAARDTRFSRVAISSGREGFATCTERPCRACSAVFSYRCTSRVRYIKSRVYFAWTCIWRLKRIDRDPLGSSFARPFRFSSVDFVMSVRRALSQPRGYRSIPRGDTRESYHDCGYTEWFGEITTGVSHCTRKETSEDREEKKRRVAC